jgi:hypothetical protein
MPPGLASIILSYGLPAFRHKRLIFKRIGYADRVFYPHPWVQFIGFFIQYLDFSGTDYLAHTHFFVRERLGLVTDKIPDWHVVGDTSVVFCRSYISAQDDAQVPEFPRVEEPR